MEIPAHQQPRTTAECIATWKARRRIPVPTKQGHIVDLQIVHLIEATAFDGAPVDLVIDARASHSAPLKRFAVVFADSQPLDNFPVPTLWVCDGVGVWVSVP